MPSFRKYVLYSKRKNKFAYNGMAYNDAIFQYLLTFLLWRFMAVIYLFVFVFVFIQEYASIGKNMCDAGNMPINTTPNII